MRNGKRSDKFNYFYSKELDQEYAVHKQNGIVTFRDGVKYSPDEIEILRECGGIPIIHRVKKVFAGELVEWTIKKK